MLKVFYLDDFIFDSSSDIEKEIPMTDSYRMVDKYSSIVEIADDLILAAVALIKMSRSPIWANRVDPRPLRQGDILTVDNVNYQYCIRHGWDLPGCRLRLKQLKRRVVK